MFLVCLFVYPSDLAVDDHNRQTPMKDFDLLYIFMCCEGGPSISTFWCFFCFIMTTNKHIPSTLNYINTVLSSFWNHFTMRNSSGRSAVLSNLCPFICLCVECLFAFCVECEFWPCEILLSSQCGSLYLPNSVQALCKQLPNPPIRGPPFLSDPPLHPSPKSCTTWGSAEEVPNNRIPWTSRVCRYSAVWNRLTYSMHT